MIAIDALEEKPTQTLHPIGADARQHLLADEFEIGSRSPAGLKSRMCNSAVSAASKRRAPSRAIAQALTSRWLFPASSARREAASASVAALAQQRSSKASTWSAPKHEPARRAARDGERLFRRELPRDRCMARRLAVFPRASMARSSISAVTGSASMPQPCSKLRPSKAPRGEDQIVPRLPKPRLNLCPPHSTMNFRRCAR